MKNNVQKIALGIIILAIGFWGGWYLNSQPETPQATPEVSVAANQVAISILETDDGTPEQFTLDYTPGRNLFTYLQRLEGSRDITMQYKDFGGGLGMFIEKINDVGDDGSNKWWQYWVNGQYANVGVSGYVPAPGDSIEFKYTDQHPTEE